MDWRAGRRSEAERIVALVGDREVGEALEQFSRFAANLVRWAARWAKHIVRQANRRMNEALQVKALRSH